MGGGGGGGSGGGKTFGLTSSTHSKRGRGSFKRRGGGGGGTGRGANISSASYRPENNNNPVAAGVAEAGASIRASTNAVDEAVSQEQKFDDVATLDAIDASLGFERVEEGPMREGWLVGIHPTLGRDDETSAGNARGKSGVDLYFIQDDGASFKCTTWYHPYFYLACRPQTEAAVEEWLLRKFEGALLRCERENKEDLKLPNHLLGYQRTFLKLFFLNVQDLLTVRRELMPIVAEAQKKLDARDAYADVLAGSNSAGGGGLDGADDIESFTGGAGASSSTAGGAGGIPEAAGAAMDIFLDQADLVDDRWTGGRARNAKGAAPNERGRGLDPQECIIDIREYDLPYCLRVGIDMGEYKAERFWTPNSGCLLQRSHHLALHHSPSAPCTGRDPRRALVQRRLRGRAPLAELHQGACEARGPVRAGVRHRDDEAAAQVPGRGDGRDHDDLVHDRRARVPHHEPRGGVGGHRRL